MNDFEYKISVKAGIAEAIKELAFSSAILEVNNELTLYDKGYSILKILKGYFPEEYDFTVARLRREREEMRKETLERLEELGGNEDGKEEL